MINPQLLTEMGFTAGNQLDIKMLSVNLSTLVSPLAEEYMQGKISIKEVAGNLSALNDVYGANLIFLLECIPALKKRYEKDGISREIFVNTLRDIKYKYDECVAVKGGPGIFAFDWYDGFFRGGRYALGRLQYDQQPLDCDDITVSGHTVSKGDMVLWCHIPSSGPLNHEDCIASYKMAYEFHNDKVKNGILPIFCGSWLLYPDYYGTVFPEGSNTAEFIRDFHILFVHPQDTFRDAWRIFGKDYDGNPHNLPAHTSMQKRVIAHLENGGSFGSATGVILFDGEKVITRR